MNSKQAADRMEKIEKDILAFRNSAKKVGWKVLNKELYDNLIQEAKEIYEPNKDGCGDKCWWVMYDNIECGKLFDFKNNKYFLCPNCKRIHKSWERINK